METRTLLLGLHIASVACWLGADLLVHLVSPRIDRDSLEAQAAWTRVQVWMHERYYPAVAVPAVLTGVLLVLDGDWSWSSDFIWVGVGAVIGGAALGGGGLGSLTKRRLVALESGDASGAAETGRKIQLLGLVVTALPLIAILAMVDKWGV